MAKKRTTAAQKRVKKNANDSNIAFLVGRIPEFKGVTPENQLTSSSAVRCNPAKSIAEVDGQEASTSGVQQKRVKKTRPEPAKKKAGKTPENLSTLPSAVHCASVAKISEFDCQKAPGSGIKQKAAEKTRPGPAKKKVVANKTIQRSDSDAENKPEPEKKKVKTSSGKPTLRADNTVNTCDPAKELSTLPPPTMDTYRRKMSILKIIEDWEDNDHAELIPSTNSSISVAMDVHQVKDFQEASVSGLQSSPVNKDYETYDTSEESDVEARLGSAKKKIKAHDGNSAHQSDIEDCDSSMELSTPPATRTYHRKMSIVVMSNETEQASMTNNCTDVLPVGASKRSENSSEKEVQIQQLQAVIDNLETKLKAEVQKNEKLQLENSALISRNNKLQEAITSPLLPKPVVPFKECLEYVDADTLKDFSLKAKTDYDFMKFVMMRLWPDGFEGRSVTGRPSNNPSGRSKSKPNAEENRCGKIALEPEKVKYCIRCLFYRRRFLQDEVATAEIRSKKGTELMTRIIANSQRPSKNAS